MKLKSVNLLKLILKEKKTVMIQIIKMQHQTIHNKVNNYFV